MTEIKKRLDTMLAEVKEQNPVASWKNIIAGFVVVLIVVFASLTYFNKLAANAVVQNPVPAKPAPVLQGEQKLPEGNKDDEKDQTANNPNATTVLEGEGLWNVAERVCGNGEMYTILATANNLSLDTELNAGQQLVVVCK